MCCHPLSMARYHAEEAARDLSVRQGDAATARECGGYALAYLQMALAHVPWHPGLSMERYLQAARPTSRPPTTARHRTTSERKRSHATTATAAPTHATVRDTPLSTTCMHCWYASLACPGLALDSLVDGSLVDGTLIDVSFRLLWNTLHRLPIPYPRMTLDPAVTSHN